jgi:hypothetical protein
MSQLETMQRREIAKLEDELARWKSSYETQRNQHHVVGALASAVPLPALPRDESVIVTTDGRFRVFPLRPGIAIRDEVSGHEIRIRPNGVEIVRI